MIYRFKKSISLIGIVSVIISMVPLQAQYYQHEGWPEVHFLNWEECQELKLNTEPRDRRGFSIRRMGLLECQELKLNTVPGETWQCLSHENVQILSGDDQSVTFFLPRNGYYLFANNADAGDTIIVNVYEKGKYRERLNDMIRLMHLEEKFKQLNDGTPSIPRLGIYGFGHAGALHGLRKYYGGRFARIKGGPPSGTYEGITMFPQVVGMGSTWDPGLVQRIACAATDEGRILNRRKDITALAFWAPNVNIARDPRWGRNEETFSEDPYLLSRMGVAYIKGMQGDDPNYLKTISGFKHFVANNEEDRRKYGSSDVGMRSLWEYYMPAFKAGIIEGGACCVMPGFNAVNQVPAAVNHYLLDQVLRKRWGFEGYVVSDCGGIDFIFEQHRYTRSETETVAMALRAGCDVCCGSYYQRFLKDAFKEGLITESDLDTALIRYFATRFRLGEFDPPEAVPFTAIPDDRLDGPEHRQLAVEAALKSIVLLENDGLLPLKIDRIDELAVIGPNANETILGGYSGIPSVKISPYQGILEKVKDSGIQVDYEKGCNLKGKTRTDYRKAVNIARKADVVILVMGTSLSMFSEQNDREEIILPEVQLGLMEAVSEVNDKIVLVLINGAPVSFGGMEKKMNAILEAWYPGQAGGTAVADVLFGDFNPGGKLPETFYQSAEDLPPMSNYDLIEYGRTYMYFDKEPLYPFGHGLSYTNFSYDNLKLNKNSFVQGDTVTISMDLQNTGEMSGDEVVQVYVKDLEASVKVAKKQLKGFQRVILDVNELKNMRFEIPVSQLTYYSLKENELVVEPGWFEIQIGSSSEDIRLRDKFLVEGDEMFIAVQH